MPTNHNKIKVIILPGNGNTDISENWYTFLKRGLEQFGIHVIAKNMPDPDLARAEYWLPFIEDELKGSKYPILVGHSSGAVAATRFSETHKVLGLVLVGTCYTDLGLSSEKQSRYYDKRWRWRAVSENSKHIAIFASRDDPYISVKEPRYIKKMLPKAEYFEYKNRGHFNDREFDEALNVILSWIPK